MTNPKSEFASYLDRAAVHVHAAQVAADRAALLAHSGDTQAAVHYAEESKQDANRALLVLCDKLGAAVPPGRGREPERMRTRTFDLTALATLDTNESRELLAALEMVQSFAEKVNYQRGHVFFDHIKTALNQSRGTNYAEDVSNLAARLRREIFGAERY